MGKIKRDDQVVVISGAHQGSRGRVLEVDPIKQRVLVEGVNVRRSAVKRSQQSPEGGFVERERPIHISNVMLQDKYEARAAKRAT